MSASKYRLRSNGRNIVKGINTRNIGCSEFKLISVPSKEVTSKPFFSSLKKTASQFHSPALHFFSFFFFLWLRLLAQFRKCGDAQLVGGVSLFNSLFEQASFRLSPPPSPHSPLKTPGQTWPVK